MVSQGLASISQVFTSRDRRQTSKSVKDLLCQVSVSLLTKIKQEKEGSRVQKAGAALPKAGGQAIQRSTAETTFEWRDLRLRRPVLPELSGHRRERAGDVGRGSRGRSEGLVGHREDFTLHETRTLLGF